MEPFGATSIGYTCSCGSTMNVEEHQPVLHRERLFQRARQIFLRFDADADVTVRLGELDEIGQRFSE